MPTAAELVKAAKEQAKAQEELSVPFLDTEILFRLPADAIEFRAIREKCKSQVKAITKTPSEVYKPYKALPEEIITQAYWIHVLSVEPKFSLVDALDMHEAGGALLYLYSQLMDAMGSVVILSERQMIDDVKNE